MHDRPAPSADLLSVHTAPQSLQRRNQTYAIADEKSSTVTASAVHSIDVIRGRAPGVLMDYRRRAYIKAELGAYRENGASTWGDLDHGSPACCPDTASRGAPITSGMCSRWRRRRISFAPCGAGWPALVTLTQSARCHVNPLESGAGSASKRPAIPRGRPARSLSRSHLIVRHCAPNATPPDHMVKPPKRPTPPTGRTVRYISGHTGRAMGSTRTDAADLWGVACCPETPQFPRPSGTHDD